MLNITRRMLIISAGLATVLTAAPAFSADKIVIGFSQASSNSAHRNTMTKRNQAYAAEHFKDVDLIVTNAEGKSAKQISDVESLMVQGMKVLMISAQDSAAIAPTIKQVLAAGIPVITLERSLDIPVTLHVGPHNKPIGTLAGKYVAEALKGKGNVVEIKGDPAVAPAVERHEGFAEAIAGTDIKVIAETHADWDQEKALKFMEDTLQRFPAGQIQAVYAHNDNMAFGALRAIQAAGRDKEGILIIGIDGENAAIRAVAKGDLTATFTYSTVAPEGVIAAHALATNDTAALEKLGTLTKKDDGSMEIEIASKMITKENAAEFFCKGFGDDPECK
ncbi:substrate-binding domain-containing protein [Rhizobium leguminosarum]|jgi:ribose transport system substrate-binding protein|uniref:substrate-binding domain-containing protein n=1 Tax=Rhizobium leguminosarum TaxID=384 RepID=UPI00037D7743|nr:substrate-binding domain-containing protein [Rhizobium leguminosarum]MBY2967405.1 substrate-binding domain-containing protein [Rhizobium leguminosarum]MBY2995844.1 substrate-binding domain-containing protein [Rhizobium leguminosarum]MBY3033922.1 substrate-binding domain-containing protein [Rhizobium leguminosarum]MBY3047311.1 substrate-binding domain-containing protein [Rhizobium leguminosarum]MBY3060521.1 substrate-binding domain-containing protein [Rhizobium leguminosarum]